MRRTPVTSRCSAVRATVTRILDSLYRLRAVLLMSADAEIPKRVFVFDTRRICGCTRVGLKRKFSSLTTPSVFLAGLKREQIP